MDEPGAPAAFPQETRERGRRLDSWKEIAAYLNRDLRTLQRWEKTANLPIRRLNKPGMRAVFAYTADLDDWLRQQSPAPSDNAPEDRSVTPAPATPGLHSLAGAVVSACGSPPSIMVTRRGAPDHLRA